MTGKALYNRNSWLKGERKTMNEIQFRLMVQEQYREQKAKDVAETTTIIEDEAASTSHRRSNRDHTGALGDVLFGSNKRAS